MKKFEEGDIFINKIKTHPKVRFFGYNGKIYINNTDQTALKMNDFLPEPPPVPEPPLVPEPLPAPVPEALSFSAEPQSISFGSSGTEIDVTITATGTGTESFNVTSNNTKFHVYPPSGTITGGDMTTIGITFNGTDDLQAGQITFTGQQNSVVIDVNSSLFITSGPSPGPTP